MKRKTTYNNIILDDVVPGFKTLGVDGRQFNEVDISSTENPEDGSTFLSRRVPKREITVTFMLKQTASMTLKESQRLLLSYLNQKEPKKLIFSDESDVYFSAIFEKAKVDEEHDKVRSGELTFICLDPYKYSCETKTFVATHKDDDLLLQIENEGTVAVPITYDFTMKSDNGYIGIVGNEAVMQFGSVEEADGEDYEKSERLMDQSLIFSTADDTTGTDVVNPQYGTTGTLAEHTWYDNTFLGFGTEGTPKNNVGGGMRTITIPADSNGVSGSKNFYAWMHLIMYAGKFGQTGEMGISFLTDGNLPIASLGWYKTDTNGNTGWYDMRCYSADANDYGAYVKVLKHVSFQCTHLQSQNPWAWNWGYCDVRKEGSKLTFFYFGHYYTFDVPEIEDFVCTKIQITFKAWKSRTDIGNNFLNCLGLYKFTFDKLNVSAWQDNPNRYSKGDVVKINGEEGKIYVNGLPRMGDEITGTEYFKAEPGDNEIQVHVSSFAGNTEVTATIREAWL